MMRGELAAYTRPGSRLQRGRGKSGTAYIFGANGYAAETYDPLLP